MTKLSKNVISLIEQMVDEGMISKRKHPVYDLFVCKYTAKAAANQVWNDATMLCRGLVVDSEYNVIEWPMRKFFNFEELDEAEAKRIFSAKHQVFEKVDGSLGILVHYNDEYFIASQGSFESKQAIWATKLLNEKYLDKVKELDTEHYTYLFEIVYPNNRIVVDYGDFADLVFLAKVDKNTGEDLLLSDEVEKEMAPFIVAKRYNEFENESISTMKDLNWKNKEGFVIHSKEGRMKLKFENYIDLHRHICGLNSKKVCELLIEDLECIKAGKPLASDEYYNKLSEELKMWFSEKASLIKLEMVKKLTLLLRELGNVEKELPEVYTQKEFAMKVFEIVPKKDTGFVFALQKGRDITAKLYEKMLPTFDGTEKLYSE